jgi:hypothetical protein
MPKAAGDVMILLTHLREGNQEASVMGISSEREWRSAKDWLHRQDGKTG